MSKFKKFLVYTAKDFTSGLIDVVCKIYNYKGNLIKIYNMKEIGDTGVYFCFINHRIYRHRYLIAIIDSITKQWKVCENLYGK